MAQIDASSAGPASAIMQRQLPLQISLRDDATLDNFLVQPDNASVVSLLRRQTAPEDEPMIYLYGPAGTGKSHLLQAACQASDAQSIYLPLQELIEYSPADIFSGIEALDLVCVDDAQCVAGRAEWESALFNFYNRAREGQCSLLVAADTSPRGLALDLEDLRSRLSWGVVFRLEALGDSEKSELLRFRAARRGISLSDSVANYIVSRAPRGMQDLLDVLDTLDEASLAQKRALSVPFAKKVLGW